MIATIVGNPFADLAIQTAAIVGALAVIFKPVRSAAVFMLRVRDSWDRIESEVTGVAEQQTEIRTQLDEFGERLKTLEQLKPDSGSSVYDRVRELRENQIRIQADQHEIARAVCEMAAYFDGQVTPPRCDNEEDE